MLKIYSLITNRKIYKKYLKYCVSIGQAHGTIEAKKQFFRYSLPKIVNADDNIATFTKGKLEEHIIFMRKAQQVFREVYEVLKLGGRLSTSDVVEIAELPENIRQDLSMIFGCMAGAKYIDNIRVMLENAEFKDIKMIPEKYY